MRILHLITSLDTGGAERMLAKLVAGMDTHKFENRVVSLMPPGPVARDIHQAGVPVDTLRMVRGVPHPGAVWRLVRILRTFRPHLMQTWLYHADFLGLAASLFHRKIPIVWNIRNADLDLPTANRTTAAVMRINAMLSQFPAAIVTNSRVAATFHKQAGYKPKRLTVLPNGFDTRHYMPSPQIREMFRREFHIPADALLVGHCARFSPVKAHTDFIDAARNVARSNPAIHFALCGDGVTANPPVFRQAIQDTALADRIHLFGRFTKMERFMAGLDIFCLSSTSEGFPNVLGEAMSCGVPCVTTDVGDCRDIVADTGRIVPPKAPEALAAAMSRLLALSPGKRQRLGQSARQRVISKYSLESIISGYQNLYESILKT